MGLFYQVHLFSFLLFLFLFICSNQGLSVLNHQEAAQENIEEMIGSKPPTCKGLFFQNGKCEPVQVPVVSKDELQTETSSRNNEDSPNYKPLSWKCKCGDAILTP